MSKFSEKLTKEQGQYFMSLLDTFITEFLNYHEHTNTVMGSDSNTCRMKGYFENTQTGQQYELQIVITEKDKA